LNTAQLVKRSLVHLYRDMIGICVPGLAMFCDLAMEHWLMVSNIFYFPFHYMG
jgi:hypothetical protein